MTKIDFVKKMAAGCGMSNGKATDAFDSLMGLMKEELLKGGTVRLPGIGTFTVVPTKARIGRNPKTGDSIKIPAGQKIKFTAGKDIKGKLKGKPVAKE